MTKIIGAVLIAISVFLFGYSRYTKFRGRPKDIDMFLSLLNGYRLELGWRRRSLKEILDISTPDGYEKYFSRVRTLLASRSPLSSFIDDNEEFTRFHLNDEDVAVLKFFFSESGKGSTANELAICEKTVAALSKLKADAEAERKKLGPLSVKLSLLSGVLVIIFFV